jgi:hypothetical protein
MVSARDALLLTDALLERNAPVSRILFDGDTHGTALNGAERIAAFLHGLPTTSAAAMPQRRTATVPAASAGDTTFRCMTPTN